MGVITKLVDTILFFFFLVVAIAAPLLDAPTLLPADYFPSFLVDLKHRYGAEYGDYLVDEKPNFFVGLMWLELLFQWPLALVNLYGILGSKCWLHTTCLIYGASVSTSMAAILAELIGSNKASDKLLMMYSPFMGLGVLAILRGLLVQSGKTASVMGRRSALGRKKRA